MNWKLFFSIFAAVFVAELADKTQIVGITMSSESGKPLLVWLASVSAYMLITGISVYFGSILSDHIKPETIRYTGGIIFLVIGLLIIFNKF